MKIIVDSREQTPWSFDFYPQIETVSKKLETGDYSIEGLEDKFTIDRKACVAEIANNIGIDKKRFEAELERMLKIKYTFLICEFSIDDVLKYPLGSNIPKSQIGKVRINGKFILKTLYGYRDKYGIQIEFCGNREKAEAKAVEKFEFINQVV